MAPMPVRVMIAVKKEHPYISSLFLIHKYVIPKNYTLFKGYNHEYSIPD